jgi:transposase
VHGRELAKTPATRYNGGMIEPLQAPEVRATLPASELALLEQAAMRRRQTAALRAENAVLPTRVRELETWLGQNSSNSSRPPSSDPPHVPAKPDSAPSH